MMHHPVSPVSEEWKKKGKEEEWKHTDSATKRISSIILSCSARVVASDRSGLYMLKKACYSIAKYVT
jgi:hypothetical protein